jgi:hypothetical protein
MCVLGGNGAAALRLMRRAESSGGQSDFQLYLVKRGLRRLRMQRLVDTDGSWRVGEQTAALRCKGSAPSARDSLPLRLKAAPVRMTSV